MELRGVKKEIFTDIKLLIFDIDLKEPVCYWFFLEVALSIIPRRKSCV